MDGVQTRTCTDDADCGTTDTKPLESQECGTEAIAEAEILAEPGQFPIFEVSVVIIVAVIAIVIVVLVLTGKIHLPNIRSGSKEDESKTEYVYSSPVVGADRESHRKKGSEDEEELQ